MSPTPSSRTIAGISIPDTPLVTKAIELIRKHLDDPSYNHSMRSCLLGFAIADKLPPLAQRDREVHAIAAILHDLGWDTTNTFVSKDRRFEVDGADAARAFVEREANGAEWDVHRKQLLWDCIALHTTPSIAQYKEVEVTATGLGIGTEFRGVQGVPGGVLTQAEWDAIAAEYPRQGFVNAVKEIMCGFCRTKPETTYDNFMSDFGEDYVEGYTRKGRRVVDMLMATVE